MWNPESTGMESGIHSVESGIQDSLGLPYMGRMSVSLGNKQFYRNLLLTLPCKSLFILNHSEKKYIYIVPTAKEREVLRNGAEQLIVLKITGSA